jgi:hypothetical protein
MNIDQVDLPARRPTFGRRKVAPRVCIADSKQHIRTFLSDALEDLGFVTSECAEAGDLGAILDTQFPDLVVLGSSADGIEAGRILEMLAGLQFGGKVLPVGPRDSIMMTAVRQLAAEFGIALLPTLATPFSSGTLRDSVATLLPLEPAPSPAVDVAEALQADWLELWYQRKIDARTMAAVGAEALVRVRHPTWGVVPPAYFVPDAKDPQLRGLSRFVIGRALDDWRYFVARQGPVDIAINLPLSFFDDPQAVRELCARMPSHPAFAGLLVEFKSAEVIANLDLAVAVARQMRLCGIAVAIDNLGAEWPALMAIETFPFVELKWIATSSPVRPTIV